MLKSYADVVRCRRRIRKEQIERIIQFLFNLIRRVIRNGKYLKIWGKVLRLKEFIVVKIWSAVVIVIDVLLDGTNS